MTAYPILAPLCAGHFLFFHFPEFLFGGKDYFGEEGFVVEVFDEIHGFGTVVGKFFGHVIFGGFGNDFYK